MIPLGNRLINLGKFRLAMFLLLLVLACSYALLPTITSYSAMALTLVLFIAVPTGAFYTISALCAIKYFPLASSKVNAMQQFGQGIGCVLISYATFKGCNPDNRPVDMHPTWKFNPNDFQIQGTFTALAIMLVMSAIFVYLYIRYPKGISLDKLSPQQQAIAGLRDPGKEVSGVIEGESQVTDDNKLRRCSVNCECGSQGGRAICTRPNKGEPFCTSLIMCLFPSGSPLERLLLADLGEFHYKY